MLKIKKILSVAVSAALTALAVISISVRAPSFIGKDDTALMAAALTMSKGNYPEPEQETEAPSAETEPPSTAPATEAAKPVSSDFDESYYNTFAKHKGAKKYPVYTQNISDGEIEYDCFYVNNSTDYAIDVEQELKQKLGFTIDKSPEVQVLIYHTHTGESYLDRDVGYYYSDYYPRTQDSRYNVTQVGEAISAALRDEGIGVVHDTAIHDNTYDGSYDRSRATVDSYLEKYPTIKVTLDIHRDSLGADDYKVKPTFTYDEAQGAQIMIMSGCDYDGGYGFPDWEQNLRFALKLQQKCEKNYPGMTRPLYFGEFVYNMNVNTGSLLIEVGTDANTLDEAVYSGKLLGKALAQVLQNTA